jgi:lipid II:glycine glycyltransferase (peptidoglycan interpeptide bridge formation enzyme)
MQRNNALENYYFPFAYFEDIFRFLPRQASLFTATVDGRVIAASIYLHHKHYFHYYFSASDGQFFSRCPNNLMVYEAIRWAQAQGFHYCSLGGGYHRNGEDSLFAFKASFSQERAPFHVYRRIHNPQWYEALAGAYASEKKISLQDALQSQYFPVYRQ